jgi:hypothetical protein
LKFPLPVFGPVNRKDYKLMAKAIASRREVTLFWVGIADPEIFGRTWFIYSLPKAYSLLLTIDTSKLPILSPMLSREIPILQAKF